MKKKISKTNFRILFVLLIPFLLILFAGFLNRSESMIKKKDYMDPRAVDPNWIVDLKFINDGLVLDEMEWNATRSNEIKNIIIQFNYKNSNAAFSYQPGDLQINITNSLRDYKGDIINIVTSSTGDDASNFDWRLVSSGGEIILENNVEIEENTNFEGSVQIAFRPDPLKIISGSDFVFSGNLLYKDSVIAEAGGVTFHFTSTRETFSYTVSSEKIQGYDGLPENAADYVWVKNILYFEKQDTGIRDVQLTKIRWNYARDLYPTNTFYFLQHVPDGAIAFDEDLNQLSVNNGTVKIESWRSLWYKMYTYVIVGYPKDEYEHSTIESQSEVHGIYWDETEDSMISTKTVNLNLDNFAFNYTGLGDGGIFKTADKQSKVSIVQASNNGATSYFDFQLSYQWGGIKEDVEIGDDYVYALNDNQEYVRLNNEEYKFTKVEWFGSKLFNAAEKKIKDYDLELWVRYSGTDEYVKYGNTLKANVNNTVSFSNSENVAAYKWIIKDVVETIKPDMNSTQAQYYGYVVTSSCYMQIKKSDLDNRSKIFNFAYIKMYQDGEWVNQKELSNYAEGVTRDQIAPLDLQVHGGYLARVYATQDVLNNAIKFSLTKKASNNSLLENNPNNEEYTGKFTINTNMDFTYGNTRSFKGVEYFDLLPKGMNFLEIYKVNAASSVLKEKIKTNSGIELTDDYLLAHFKCVAHENFNGTGRTLVKITWDFSDDPLDLSIDEIVNGDLSNIYLPSFVMSVVVPYESFLENSTIFENTIYMEPVDRENIDFIPFTRINDYNGVVQSLDIGDKDHALKETIDLNENGTLDYMFTSKAKLEVIDLVASHQDLLTLVETNQSNFNSKNGLSSNETEYLYKLRVHPSNNDITNVIIYDNIESAYGDNEHWNGKFNGIDISYATEKGYVLGVYYSENPMAGTLSSDNSWKMYDENTVDKTKVKSLAFKILDSEGNYAYLPSNSYVYVIIKMIAPKEDSYNKAYNNSWTEWTAYNNGFVVDGVNGITSNIVEVKLPGTSVHNTEENGDDSGDIVSPNTYDKIRKIMLLFVILLPILIICVRGINKTKQPI